MLSGMDVSVYGKGNDFETGNQARYPFAPHTQVMYFISVTKISAPEIVIDVIWR